MTKFLVEPDPNDSAALRAVYGCFPSGVTALCAQIDGETVGMAASSFTAVSVDPPLVSVCIQQTSATWPRLRRSPRLGVSLFAVGQELTCRALAGRGDRFAGVAHVVGDGGAIYIEQAAVLLDCTVDREVNAGDHIIALLRIQRMFADLSAVPLVFHRRDFRVMVDRYSEVGASSANGNP